MHSNSKIFFFYVVAHRLSVGRSRSRAKQVALKVQRWRGYSIRTIRKDQDGGGRKKDQNREKDQDGRADGAREQGRRAAEGAQGGSRCVSCNAQVQAFIGRLNSCRGRLRT